MTTTLTKAILLDKAKPRFEWVEVNGFGKVGFRTCGQVQLSRRWVSYVDVNGKPIEAERAKGQVHKLIDQLMTSPTESMFKEEDYNSLAELDSEVLAPLLEALAVFNGEDEKKVSAA